MLLRLAINVLFARFNVLKAIKNIKPVVRLGAACGTFNLVFHLIRRWFALKRRACASRLPQGEDSRHKWWLSQEFELVAACSLASLGLHLAPEGDMRIFKVVVFSRAVNSVVTYIGESTGWFKPIGRREQRHLTVEYGLAASACMFLVYCYIFEPMSMTPAIRRTITRGLHLNHDEMRLFDCLRAMSELEGKIGVSSLTPSK